MTTNFEFLPRSSRRVHLGWKAPAAFLITGLTFLGTAGWLHVTARDLQSAYEREVATIEVRAAELASAAMAILPDPGPIEALRDRVIRHNTALIGPRTPWTRIFDVLEEFLPADAVVARLDRLSSGKPEFPGGALDLKILLVVAQIEAANQFYLKLSSDRRFDEVSFMPRGEMVHQGRSGIGIEVSFRFIEGKTP